MRGVKYRFRKARVAASNMNWLRNAGCAGEIPSRILSDQWGMPWLSWLIYRWAAACYFTVWLVLAIVEFSDVKAKYLLNVTSWAFILLAGVCVLKATLLTMALRSKVEKLRSLQLKGKGVMTYDLKLLWVGDNVASVLALGVTVGFWAIINRDGSQPVTAVTVHTHGVNALYALVDLMLSARTVRPLHCWQPVLFSTVYVIFSAIYWAAGGTGKEGHPYIYPSLDWRKPAKTVPISLGLCILLPIASHLFLYGIYRIRMELHQRIRNGNCSNDGERHRELREDVSV